MASRFIAFGRQAGVNFFKIKKSPKVENISSAVKKWGGGNSARIRVGFLSRDGFKLNQIFFVF